MSNQKQKKRMCYRRNSDPLPLPVGDQFCVQAAGAGSVPLRLAVGCSVGSLMPQAGTRD